MITFDLSCDQGHRFEGWFRNRQEFERQLGEGLLVCPLCGSGKVRKEPCAPAVHVGRRTAPERPEAGPRDRGRPRPEAFFLALARFVERNFEDVGGRFAEEARKIHRGEAEARNIRGTTTSEEEEALREEGVEFLKVPLPKYDA